MEVVFDRELEKKRAELERKREQFYRENGRSGGVEQVVNEEKRRRKERQQKNWLDWYFQFNQEEGFEQLWSKVSGVDNGKEVVIREGDKEVKRITGYQTGFY